MNKYNIGDTVYYVTGTGIRKGEVHSIEQASDVKEVVIYTVYPNYSDNPSPLYQRLLHKTVDGLIEWLRTTVKE